MNTQTQSTASNPGKGSQLRPTKVSWKTFSDNWDSIFGKNKLNKCCGQSCGCHKDRTEDVIIQ